jgi:hypothetical protein
VSDAASLPQWWVIGFTGHRHLVDPEAIARLVGQTIDDLRRRNPWLSGVASAAAGSDTIFGEEMRRRGHPLRVVLPFATERFKQDFHDDPEGWSRVEALLEAAASVEVVPPIDPDPAVAYMDSGIQTVDAADVVIAVWDGRAGSGPGGTADAVRYARAVKRPLIVIDPVTGQSSAERLENLPSPGTAPITPATVGDPEQLVRSYFEAVNLEAADCAPRVRHLMRWYVWLHLIAASLAAAVTVFAVPFEFAVGVGIGEAGVLITAFVILTARGRRYHAWLRLRAEAEICRSFLATWQIRRRVRPVDPAVHPLPGLERLSRTLDLLQKLDRSPGPSFESAKRTYAVTRIADQKTYFEDKKKTADRQSRRRSALARVSTFGAASASVLGTILLLAGRESPGLAEWLEFFAITLPLAATACGLLLVTEESTRRSVRYGEMVESLTVLQVHLDASPTWQSLARVAAGIEETLMQEVLEWRAFVRHTEHLH